MQKDSLSKGKDYPLSRKLQAQDMTTRHDDSLLIRNFNVQTILCGYLRSLSLFMGPALLASPELVRFRVWHVFRLHTKQHAGYLVEHSHASKAIVQMWKQAHSAFRLPRITQGGRHRPGTQGQPLHMLRKTACSGRMGQGRKSETLEGAARGAQSILSPGIPPLSNCPVQN